MDIQGLNRTAWEKAVEAGENPTLRWYRVSKVADARAGSWAIRLSEHRTVPREWFSSLPGLRVLCLAASGGQQAPSPRPVRRSRCLTGLLVSSARTLSWQSVTGLSCDLCSIEQLGNLSLALNTSA
jgi:hypothetical protein